MNIFVTDIDPILSAKNLDDRRVCKMIVESTQLLSNALHSFKNTFFLPLAKSGLPYKTSHMNHPCSVWTRLTRANYIWLAEHATALANEYTLRYGKIHFCAPFIELAFKGNIVIPDKFDQITSFANCSLFPDKPIIAAYRYTMCKKWKKDGKAARWTNSNKPVWFDDYNVELEGSL